MRPLSADVIGDVGQMLWVLLGTVGIVLLIACANVANLFLVRAEGRQQELAIHAALGASWRRIAWELLSESLALRLRAAPSGSCSPTAACARSSPSRAGGAAARRRDRHRSGRRCSSRSASRCRRPAVRPDPGHQVRQAQLAGALKEGGRLSSAGRERHRARNTLVVAEIALAVVLLVASGLMIRTFLAMRQVEPGFTQPEKVLTLRVAIPASIVQDPEQTARTHEQIAAQIEQMPGVASVGLSSSITMDGFDSNDPIFVEDFPRS